MSRLLVVASILATLGLVGCDDASLAGTSGARGASAHAGDARAAAIDGPPNLGYRVVATFPHDDRAFTQGLVYVDGRLYESTGLRGRSSVREVDMESGVILRARPLADRFFGEGLAAVGDRLVQLTWVSREGFVYDRESLLTKGRFRYATEGWGLTHDGSRLIMSDGSANLYLLDPERFTEIARIAVHDRGEPVSSLNELEYVAGSIYANIWPTSRIARIDLGTGQVTGWLDLSELARANQGLEGDRVLNGIAYDTDSGRLLVTGKLWPRLYLIEVLPEPRAEGRQ